MQQQKRILISACLLGVHCRYDGQSKPSDMVLKQCNPETIFIPICPEQLGGLSTPRIPCEIIDGEGQDVWQTKSKVCDSNGNDFTEAYQNGAKEALCLAQLLGAEEAWLTARSPSCGCGQIYDGSFSGTLREGDGVCAALLKNNGIIVKSIDINE